MRRQWGVSDARGSDGQRPVAADGECGWVGAASGAVHDVCAVRAVFAMDPSSVECAAGCRFVCVCTFQCVCVHVCMLYECQLRHVWSFVERRLTVVCTRNITAEVSSFSPNRVLAGQPAVSLTVSGYGLSLATAVRFESAGAGSCTASPAGVAGTVAAGSVAPSGDGTVLTVTDVGASGLMSGPMSVCVALASGLGVDTYELVAGQLVVGEQTVKIWHCARHPCCMQCVSH